MNKLEKTLFNVKQEIESYAHSQWEEGYESARSEFELDDDKINEIRQGGWQDGFDTCKTDMTATPLQLVEFAIKKIEEAKLRGLSMDNLLAELVLEKCSHMPVIGKTLFDK